MDRAEDGQFAVGRRQESARQRELGTHYARRDALRFDSFGRFGDKDGRHLFVQIPGRMVVQVHCLGRAAGAEKMLLMMLVLLAVGFVVDLRR